MKTKKLDPVLRECLEIAGLHYGDRDQEQFTERKDSGGDGLALFIRQEITSVFNPGASRVANLDSAAHAIYVASCELLEIHKWLEYRRQLVVADAS